MSSYRKLAGGYMMLHDFNFNHNCNVGMMIPNDFSRFILYYILFDFMFIVLNHETIHPFFA